MVSATLLTAKSARHCHPSTEADPSPIIWNQTLPEGPVGVPNLTGVLIATTRNPQAGPRRQTDQRPQAPRKRRRRAGSPTHSFHAGAATPLGTWGLIPKYRAVIATLPVTSST